MWLALRSFCGFSAARRCFRPRGATCRPRLVGSRHHFIAPSPRRDARPVAMSHLSFAAAPVAALRSIPRARRASHRAPVAVRAVSTAPSSGSSALTTAVADIAAVAGACRERAPRPRPSLSLALPPNRPRSLVRATPGTPTAPPARRPPRARRGFSRAHPPPIRPEPGETNDATPTLGVPSDPPDRPSTFATARPIARPRPTTSASL